MVSGNSWVILYCKLATVIFDKLPLVLFLLNFSFVLFSFRSPCSWTSLFSPTCSISSPRDRSSPYWASSLGIRQWLHISQGIWEQFLRCHVLVWFTFSMPVIILSISKYLYHPWRSKNNKKNHQLMIVHVLEDVPGASFQLTFIAFSMLVDYLGRILLSQQ